MIRMYCIVPSKLTGSVLRSYCRKSTPFTTRYSFSEERRLAYNEQTAELQSDTVVKFNDLKLFALYLATLKGPRSACQYHTYVHMFFQIRTSITLSDTELASIRLSDFTLSYLSHVNNTVAGNRYRYGY